MPSDDRGVVPPHLSSATNKIQKIAENGKNEFSTRSRTLKWLTLSASFIMSTTPMVHPARLCSAGSGRHSPHLKIDRRVPGGQILVPSHHDHGRTRNRRGDSATAVRAAPVQVFFFAERSAAADARGPGQPTRQRPDPSFDLVPGAHVALCLSMIPEALSRTWCSAAAAGVALAQIGCYDDDGGATVKKTKCGDHGDDVGLLTARAKVMVLLSLLHVGCYRRGKLRGELHESGALRARVDRADPTSMAKVPMDDLIHPSLLSPFCLLPTVRVMEIIQNSDEK